LNTNSLLFTKKATPFFINLLEIIWLAFLLVSNKTELKTMFICWKKNVWTRVLAISKCKL